MIRFRIVSLHNYSSTFATAIYFAVFIYRHSNVYIYFALAHRAFNLFHTISTLISMQNYKLSILFHCLMQLGGISGKRLCGIVHLVSQPLYL